MALRPRKKSAESCKANFLRISSPSYSFISQALARGLKNFMKEIRSQFLGLEELKGFLAMVHFLKKEESEEDLKDLRFMWKLLCFENFVHISDVFAFVLTVLDIEIPKRVLSTGVVFKGIGKGLDFVKFNSRAFNRNFLENLYEKSKGIFLNSPKSRENSFSALKNKKNEKILKKGILETRPPSRLKNCRTLLKRSKSNSRNTSRELLIFSSNENTKRPTNLEVFSTKHKNLKEKKPFLSTNS